MTGIGGVFAVCGAAFDPIAIAGVGAGAGTAVSGFACIGALGDNVTRHFKIIIYIYIYILFANHALKGNLIHDTYNQM